MNYVLLPRLVIRHANALAGVHVINAAPVMALNLFAHNLARHVLPAGFAYDQVGTAILHHDAQMLGEWGGDGFYDFHPQQRRGASLIDKTDYSSKNKQALSLQPVATCHLTLSLVLTLPGDLSMQTLCRFLDSARIAGGVVLTYDPPQIAANWQALKIPDGFWLVERADLMTGHPLDALFSAIGQRSHDPAAQARATTPPGNGALALPHSWIVPTVLAYAAVTPFAQGKTGQRMSMSVGGELEDTPPHAWSEALLGLVQYASRRHWAQTSYGAQLPFWRPGWIDKNVFAVQQTPTVCPRCLPGKEALS